MKIKERRFIFEQYNIYISIFIVATYYVMSLRIKYL